MSLTPIATITPGQRVKWTHRSSGSVAGIGSTTKRGAIVRVTPSTVLIKPDHGSDEVRRNADRLGRVDLEILTPLEVALEAWAGKQPDTDHVTATARRGNLVDPGAQVEIRLDDTVIRARMAKGEITYDQALRAIARECALLTLWLDERPTAESQTATTTSEEPTT